MTIAISFFLLTTQLVEEGTGEGVIWYDRDFTVEPSSYNEPKNYYREFKIDRASVLSVFLNCKNPSGVITWAVFKCDASTLEQWGYGDPVFIDYAGRNLISHRIPLEEGTYTLVFVQMKKAIGITKFDINVRLEPQK